jgi:uncharacterized protein YdaU (DUF1376 family)
MAKDPAFLFYSSDFLSGVQDLTMEERGQYITLLCMQHVKGRLTRKLIDLICHGNATADVMAKFATDENGMLFNQRLEVEIEKRRLHAEKQRDRAINGWNKRKTKDATAYTTADATALPLENEDVNKNINKKIKEKEKFIAPELSEVIAYFEANGYPSTHATHVFNYYNDANWKDAKGQPVRNWKQKMRGVWFDEKYKTQKTLTNTTYAPITTQRP